MTLAADVEEVFSDDEAVVFPTAEVSPELIDCASSTTEVVSVAVAAVVGTTTVEEAVLAETLEMLEGFSASQEPSVCSRV